MAEVDHIDMSQKPLSIRGVPAYIQRLARENDLEPEVVFERAKVEWGINTEKTWDDFRFDPRVDSQHRPLPPPPPAA